ncbi:MAG TPA: DHH family phosphoesterase [Acidobacteriota bacterium]|nr:DHH family phosphoesterase [Acidobacteriota bacterium]
MKEIWDRFMQASSINIYTHNGPDGDSLGSCVGLKRMILAYHPNATVRVVCLDAFAGKLATCDAAKEVEKDDSAADLYVYPDTPRKSMVGALRTPSICIDHHKERVPFADVEFVKVWPSCAGLLYNELKDLGLAIPPQVATAFLIGAITDTNFGMYGPQEERTKAINDILQLDLTSQQYTRQYVSSFCGLSFEQEEWLAKLYSHVHTKNGILWILVPKSSTKNRSLSDIRMCMQEITNRISAEFYIWGYEYNGKMRFSVRSDTVDVSVFAKRFDGGGHAGAASFEIDHEYDPKKVISDFEEYIRLMRSVKQE